MVLHLVRMGAITALISACTFLPFLPGPYDGLAVTLSGMAQLLGVVGLIFVPIGALWLIYEYRKRKDKGYYFAIASIIASSFVAAIVSIVAFANIGFSLGIIVLAFWAYGVSRIVPKLKLLKNAERYRQLLWMKNFVRRRLLGI